MRKQELKNSGGPVSTKWTRFGIIRLRLTATHFYL